MSVARQRFIAGCIIVVIYVAIVSFVADHARSTYAATILGIPPKVLPLNIEWEKVLENAGLGWVLSAIGSLTVWLYFRRVGHRSLVVEFTVFCISMAISRFDAAVNLYLHGVNYAVGWQRVSLASGLAFAIHAWQQRYNILKTMSVSEQRSQVERVVEKDEMDNETMAYEFHMEALDRLQKGAEGRNVELPQRG